jgi:ribosomal protein S19E (S16A)
MKSLAKSERTLLEALANAGKPTELVGGDALVAKQLEQGGLVFNTRQGAIISPKGRRVLADLHDLTEATAKKTRFGFLPGD